MTNAGDLKDIAWDRFSEALSGDGVLASFVDELCDVLGEHLDNDGFDNEDRWKTLLSLVETYGKVTLEHLPNGGRTAKGDRVPFNAIIVGTELRNSGFKHFNQGLDDTVETLRKIKDHDTTT